MINPILKKVIIKNTKIKDLIATKIPNKIYIVQIFKIKIQNIIIANNIINKVEQIINDIIYMNKEI